MFGSRERLYNRWVSEHYRFLMRSAWALTGSRVVAEEVVQDCFELAWRHMHQLRDRTLARAWLFRILRREALRNIALPSNGSAEAYDEALDDRSDGDGVRAIEQRLDVLRALQCLAPIHREVLTLFYFQDMPVAEMAIALEVAPGTVLSRLNRAREALRRHFDPMAAAPPAAPAPQAQVLDFPTSQARASGDE